MAITLAVLAVVYITGTYLVVSSFTKKPEWFEDEQGELHYYPDVSTHS